MAYTRLLVPPAAEPITLEQAKRNLRVDHNDDNDIITRKITEAREWVEQRIQQKVALATYEKVFDAFPVSAGALDLVYFPVQSMVQFVYDDVDEVEQTLVLDTDYWRDQSLLYPVGLDWPESFDRANTVRVQFTAGYSDNNLIPTPVLSAIYLKIKGLYDGDDVDGAIHSLLMNYYQLGA